MKILNTSRTSWAKKLSWHKGVVALAACMAVLSSSGQTANTYNFASTTGATLVDMTGSTSMSVSGDDSQSVLTNIGFTFIYEGVAYTQFSANSNGSMRLGGAVGTAFSNTGTFTATTLHPLWDDHSTAANGVRTILNGTSGSFVRVVDFNLNISFGTASNIQVLLYEGTNVIEFRYGTAATTGSATIAIVGANTANFISVTPPASSSTATRNNAVSGWPGAGRSYTFTAPPPPACPVPVVNVVGVSATSADVNWTCTGCTGSFIVEYGAIGFTPGTGATAGAGGTVITGATSPTTLFSLPPAGTHVYVRQNCGVDGFSANSPVASFIPGDACSSALDLATLPNPYNGNTTGFNNDYSNACAFGNIGSDMVFFIDVPDGNQLSIVHASPGYDSEINVYYGGVCPGVTLIACWDDPDDQTVLWTNTTGSTQRVYWVQDGWSTGTNNFGTFTLQWAISSCPTPVANAASNITLTSGDANWTPTTGNFILEYGPAATFTTPGTDATAGANGTAVAVTSSPYTIPGLSNGTQYRYFVRTDCGGGSFSPNSAGQVFTTLFPPPANDLCEDAIALTCGVPVTGSTTAANNVGAPGITCGTSASTAGGVWYTLSGVCGSTTASLCTGTNYDSKLFVYTGTCGGFTCVGGNDDGCGAQSTVTWTADASTTYYVYVAGFGSATGTYELVANCGGAPLAATALVTDDCLLGNYTVDVDISDLGSGGSADIVYVVNGGTPTTLSGAGLGVTPVGPFLVTDVVTVTVGNGSAGCGVDLGEFTSNCPVVLSCGSTTTVNYCYKNNDSKTWTYTSPTVGETVTLTFVSGTIDELGDVVRIYDGEDNTGTLLVSSTVNSLVGLTATSTGQSIYMEVDSDPSNSCQDGGQSSWTFEVECTPGCVDPDGSVTVTTDCNAYNFTIDVEILFVGDAPGGTTSISYTVNGGAPTVIPGLFDFDIQNLGTFAIDDVVAIQLLHETDALCNRNLGTFTDDNTCAPPSENCQSAQNLATLTSPYSSTTVGYLDDLSSYPGGCQSNTSPDRVFYIDVPNGFTLTIGQTANGYDSENYVGYGGTCPGTTQIACYDDPDIQNAVWTNTTGTTQRVYWVQDGFFNAGNAGTFTLAWNLSAPCTGIPTPGATLSTSTTVCPLANFTLSLENVSTEPGITYQWFVSTVSDSGPWTPITGGTNATLVRNQSEQSWYYCEVTCISEPAPGNSTPIQIDMLNDPIACLCTPTYTFGKTDGDLISNVVITGTTLSNNTGTDPVNPAYTYFNTLPNHTGILAAGTSYTIQVTVGTFSGQNVAVWIDFNENGVFEPSERVGFTTTSIGSNGTGSFTLSLPCDPTPGVKRMRIRDVWNTPGNTIDPCANYGWGETEDYDVTVAPPPPCPAPSGLAASNITGTTADLNWVTGCTETAWVVEYGVTGYTLGTGTSVSTVATTTSLSGLTGSTIYDVYVRADCDANGLSSWLGPVTFETAPINDLCANAIAIGCNSVTTGSTASASTTGAPVDVCGTNLNTAGGVWYTVAGWNGPMTASLCGSGFDTKIGVYTGSCGALVCVTGNDDFCGLQSQVSWNGANGTTYYIYVTGFSSATGSFTLTTSCGDNNSACTENGLTLEFQTDAAPFETTWEIRNSTGAVVATSGGPLVAPFGVQTESGCVPDGCYTLRVLDAGGDGMTTGGYILRTQGTNQRIIDNRNNFSSGSVSAISGGQGFCLPISNQGLVYTSCDKLDWINGQFVVASPDAAVSAEWVVGGSNAVQDNNSGYEFWIFDPNGSYSFRRFRSHNVSDGFGPASATRACHMKLNNWGASTQVPANVLMNVRVRARVNGVNGEFGPACRLEINPVLAACPQTNLMDIPGNQYFSCGVFRNWGVGNYVHARPVAGANRYQFRFRLPAEGFQVVRQTTTYFVQLNWNASSGGPLEVGKTYDVDVRVSKDGGATWCSDSDPWGNVCQVTIGTAPANAMADMIGNGAAAEVRMFPNPNRGDVLTFSLSAVEEGVNTVTMDVYDLSGKRVITRQIAVAGGNVNTNVDLNGELAAGMYTVNIIAGTKTYNERLVIQP